MEVYNLSITIGKGKCPRKHALREEHKTKVKTVATIIYQYVPDELMKNGKLSR